MNKDDAEEYTQSLGQIVGGSYRQIVLAKRLGVPDALGMSVEQWVNQRLGGYVKLAADDRRKAVEELAAEGESTRDIGSVLGVSHTTVERDLTGTNVPERPAKTADAGTNVPVQPLAQGEQGAANAAPLPEKTDESAANAAPPSPDKADRQRPKPPANAEEFEALQKSITEYQAQINELRQQCEEMQADIESLQRVEESNDKIKAALAEAKRYRELNRILEERIRGLQNEKNEAVRAAKAWQRKADKANGAAHA